MARGGPRTSLLGRPDARLLRGLALVALALSASACRGVLSAPGGPSADAGSGRVVQVIDGDTVDIRLDGTTERVRLIGVDTPETVAHDRAVQCFGAEASARTKALLPPGTEVRVERDEVTRDQYGRLLAYVWRIDDEVLVNLALVEGGFADAVTFGDNEALYSRFAAAEAKARADGTGLWSTCGGPDVDLGAGPPG